jgi:hypothetical protein
MILNIEEWNKIISKLKSNMREKGDYSRDRFFWSFVQIIEFLMQITGCQPSHRNRTVPLNVSSCVINNFNVKFPIIFQLTLLGREMLLTPCECTICDLCFILKHAALVPTSKIKYFENNLYAQWSHNVSANHVSVFRDVKCKGYIHSKYKMKLWNILRL